MTALRPEVVAQVSRVAAPSVASITLTLHDGRTVVWGTTDRTDEKAEKLTALLTQPGRVYDVSSPDLPTVDSDCGVNRDRSENSLRHARRASPIRGPPVLPFWSTRNNLT